MCKKMLAHRDFVDPEERQVIRDELTSLYYNWASACASDLNFRSSFRKIKKLRKMGPSYATIFWNLFVRMMRKLLRAARPRAIES